MRKLITLSLFISFFSQINAQQCPFEKSNGTESATYFEAIEWYKDLDKASTQAVSYTHLTLPTLNSV